MKKELNIKDPERHRRFLQALEKRYIDGTIDQKIVVEQLKYKFRLWELEQERKAQ